MDATNNCCIHLPSQSNLDFLILSSARQTNLLTWSLIFFLSIVSSFSFF